MGGFGDEDGGGDFWLGAWVGSCRCSRDGVEGGEEGGEL